MNNDYLWDFTKDIVEQLSPYIVYVKTNSSGYITAVNSSAFLTDTTGWVEIDSGYGDKYHHAQGNYFPAPIFTDNAAYRYKLVDGEAVECTEEEIAEQEEMNQPVQQPTADDRIAALEAENAMLMECILEMSEIIYA